MTAHTGTDEVPLLTLHIQVCRNCVDRLPGECHVPGCFYWLRSITEVPTHLDAYVVAGVSETGDNCG